MAVEETFGISISDNEASDLFTPAMLIALVCDKVNASDGPAKCLSQIGFHCVRKVLVDAGVQRRAIMPHARVMVLLEKTEPRTAWPDIRQHLVAKFGLKKRPLFPPATVADLVRKLAANEPDQLHRHSGWTRGGVRRRIREIIVDNLGVADNFSDHAESVRDLGCD